MSKIIGIDLGTTNSAAAVMMGGEPIIIPSRGQTTGALRGGDRKTVRGSSGALPTTGHHQPEHDLLDQAFHGTQSQRRRGSACQRLSLFDQAPNGDVRGHGRQITRPPDLRDDPWQIKRDAEAILANPSIRLSSRAGLL